MRIEVGDCAWCFEVEQLERRRLLTAASVSATHVLNIVGDDVKVDTIFVNRLSNGKVSVTGVVKLFTPGSASGEFNKINIVGGKGNDRVTISSNVPYTSATISGNAGNDTLTGGKGNDSINGGSGNDTLDGGGAGADSLVGGADFDTANYSTRTDNLTITLDGKANDGSGKGAEKDNVQTEEVITGSGNDTLTGSAGDDFLAGGAGDDVISGLGGDDDLIGCTGHDQLFGGAGDDFLQAKNQDRDTVNGGSNPDGSPDFDLASVDSIDQPGISAQAATTNGNEGSVTGIEQFVSDDQLSGQETLLPLAARLSKLTTWGLLYVHGQPNTAGAVTLTAGDNGNTILFRNATVDGEPQLLVNINGVDLPYDPTTTTQIAISSGAGNDLIQANDRTRVPMLIHAGRGDDTVVGGARSDTIFGDDGNDSISGGAQNDILVGGIGKDTLFGNDGRDILIGGADSDHLYGERGEDILIGGTTTHDNDPIALGNIMDEWNSSASQSARIQHLTTGGGLNGSFILSNDMNAGQTVFADKGNNFLNGGSDRDWFFKQASDVTKQSAGEVIEKL